MAIYHVNEKTSDRINVSEKDIIEVKLDENPTTGYKWMIEEINSNDIQLVDEEYQRYEKAGIGGGGQKIFKLKVLKDAKGRIKFVNKQRWSDDVYKTFVFNYM